MEIGFFQALSNFAFLQNAFLGAFLASIACGLAGPFVVVKRIGTIAGGIAHAALGGMGIAYYLGANPLWGALWAALFSALLIGWVSLKSRVYEDLMISSLWATGMAVGILFIVHTPGYRADLMSYLFGNILIMGKSDLILMASLDLILVTTLLVFFKQFVAVTFDEEFARLRGIQVTGFYILLLCLIALTTVILIQVVGLILVIALLTMPAGIAGMFVRSLRKMMIVAISISIILTLAGLFVSYYLNLPSGAIMILIVSTVFFLSLGVNKWRLEHQSKPA